MLKVDLLGGFQISDKSNTLNNANIKSDMLIKLLSYIIIHRERTLSVQDLADALWQDGETDNPSGALKNLMYRLRIILKKAFGDKEFVLTNRGSYQWNTKIEILVDFECFENKCKKAKDFKEKGDAKNQIIEYEEAITLYKGALLSKYSDVPWVVPMASYYHSIYLTSIKKLAQIYLDLGKYEEVEKMCTNALKIDSVDERMYIYIIRSLVLQNKRELAIEYYEKAEKILYALLGIKNTPAMCSVYEDLLKMQNCESITNMHEIHDGIVEDDFNDGAFVCGFSIFKELYRIEARKIRRLGIAEYIVLFTVVLKDESDKPKLNKFKHDKAIAKLISVTKDSLRMGDIISKYSNSQLVILLNACSYEESLIISQRIVKKFSNDFVSWELNVNIDIEPVLDSIPFIKKGYKNG